MRYFITENGVKTEIYPDRSFIKDGRQYLGGFLYRTPIDVLIGMGIEVEDYPPPPPPSVEEICVMIDKERDRRMELDFIYDFGDIIAMDDFNNTISAGIRNIQMRAMDRANWTTLQGAALTAAISGQDSMVMPMRAEDNYNIMTTASQVLEILALVTSERSKILFYGGGLKQAVRMSEDPHSINIYEGWPE